MKKYKPTIVGHRGCGSSEVGGTSIYPENSFFSFKKAADFKIDGIELDTWLTKDNEVVVIHGTDGFIGSTLIYGKEMKNKYIEELTCEEIQSFHFKEPWILNKGNNFYNANSNESEKLSTLSEREKLEKKKDYYEFDKIYYNIKENDEIENFINENFFNNYVINADIETENTEKGQEREEKLCEYLEIDKNIKEEEFVKNIECSYCKFIYINYLSKKNYELKKKQVIFKFISMFLHVPLLKDILKIFRNKISYDIELKGTKENIGLYILNILEKYECIKVKISSFNWIMQDNQMRKKILKNKNMEKLDYYSYPFYNMGKIDLLKVLINNKLNIPLALLFPNDKVIPNINSILCCMKYYNAQWIHFPHNLNNYPIVLNCNKKNKIISMDFLVKILHKNGKKIMIYWDGENKDKVDDILYYIKLKVDSLCPNDIALSKKVMQKEEYINAIIKKIKNKKIANEMKVKDIFRERRENRNIYINYIALT